jgi:hypothetical protein
MQDHAWSQKAISSVQAANRIFWTSSMVDRLGMQQGRIHSGYTREK